MIYVDSRIGSVSSRKKSADNLLRLFRAPTAVTLLEAGDYAFWGQGVDNARVAVGVERKTVNEIVSDILGHNRLVEQVVKMHTLYDESYLIVEGMRREGADGLLEVPRGRDWQPAHRGQQQVTFQAYVKRLNSYGVLGRMRVERTNGARETVRLVEALADWWAAGVDKHSTLRAVYAPLPGYTALVRPSHYRKFVDSLPGVGYELAARLSRRFDTPRKLVNAGPDELCEVERIGKGLAAKLHHFFETGKLS